MIIHGTQDPCISDIAFAQGRNNGGENVLVQPIPFGVGEQPDVGHCLRSGASKADKHESTTYVAQPMAFAQNTRDEVRFINGDGAIVGALSAEAGMKQQNYIAQPMAEHYTHDYCRDRVYSIDGSSPALNCTQSHTSRVDMAVRRLTPVECERLQGFPDNYTNIPKAADGPRYKALGNSMAVPVMHWIGRRISAKV